jgi:hypothetical protein
MEKIRIFVPTSLADVTVAQYRKIAKLDTTKNHKHWLVDAISIFCNITKEQVRGLSLKDMNKIASKISKLKDAEQHDDALKPKIKFKGKDYGFHPNLSKLTVGEFADIETYCKNGLFENIGSILNILYRPITFEAGDFYQIEDYTGEGDPKKWDTLKMDVVMGALNFFLSIGETLTIDLANYSIKKKGAI